MKIYVAVDTYWDYLTVEAFIRKADAEAYALTMNDCEVIECELHETAIPGTIRGAPILKGGEDDDHAM